MEDLIKRKDAIKAEADRVYKVLRSEGCKETYEECLADAEKTFRDIPAFAKLQTENDKKNCSTCYYEGFDARAYPCSRCIRNIPSRDMWEKKIAKDTNVRSKEPYFVTENGCEFYVKE